MKIKISVKRLAKLVSHLEYAEGDNKALRAEIDMYRSELHELREKIERESGARQAERDLSDMVITPAHYEKALSDLRYAEERIDALTLVAVSLIASSPDEYLKSVIATKNSNRKIAAIKMLRELYPTLRLIDGKNIVDLLS